MLYCTVARDLSLTEMPLLRFVLQLQAFTYCTLTLLYVRVHPREKGQVNCERKASRMHDDGRRMDGWDDGVKVVTAR